jgi:hypothetical protein
VTLNSLSLRTSCRKISGNGPANIRQGVEHTMAGRQSVDLGLGRVLYGHQQPLGRYVEKSANVVAPSASSFGRRFALRELDQCRRLNGGLAPDAPNRRSIEQSLAGLPKTRDRRQRRKSKKDPELQGTIFGRRGSRLTTHPNGVVSGCKDLLSSSRPGVGSLTNTGLSFMLGTSKKAWIGRFLFLSLGRRRTSFEPVGPALHCVKDFFRWLLGNLYEMSRFET